MRFLLLTVAALLSQASTAAPPEAATPALAPGAKQLGVVAGKECRKATSYNAQEGLDWRSEPLQPRKLTELPPAQGYMAVYRVVNGCEEPLAVAEYRRVGP